MATLNTSPVNSGTGTRTDVTLKLPQLQNFCKRDPVGYRQDYDAQIRRLHSECQILRLSPSSNPSPRLVELIQFAAAVSSSSYRGEESDRIVSLFIDLLTGGGGAIGSASSNGMVPGKNTSSSSTAGTPSGSILSVSTGALQLHRDVRRATCSALIIMRNKGAVPPLVLLELFFKLMSAITDKTLRETLYRHMVNDIRNINKKGKNEKLNRTVQAFLHKVIMISSSNSGKGDDNANDMAAKRCVDMVCELYRRGVWANERTVAILASAVKSPMTAVMSRAIRFFLNIEEKMEYDRQREEEDEWLGANRIDLHLHSKKTQRRKQQVEKQVKNRKKQMAKREQRKLGEDISNFDKSIAASKKLYPAIELLHDPQGLAEHVFTRLKHAGSNSVKFEIKLLMINFCTRLVGNHELLILQLYPFLQRYMGGHQRDVTAILAYSVQACHEYVPPEEVYGVLKTIAHNFITERCSGEQMAVGINAVRAICARVPSVLSTEEDPSDEGTTGSMKTVKMDMEAFAQDLAAYTKHNDRSAAVAGKAWMNFVREVHPSLLAGKDRGMAGAALHRAGEKPLRYGERRVASGVAGADLLLEYEAKKNKAKDNKEDSDDDDGENEEPMNDDVDSGDDKDGWIDVDDDDDKEDIQIDSDDDDEVAPQLVDVQNVDSNDATKNPAEPSSDEVDLSKMTTEERNKIQQEVSGTRVFSMADFEKMRKLVARAEKEKRDPRAAARRKRALANGKGDFEALSDDSEDESDMSDSDEEDEIRIAGAVNPGDIMAIAKKKRISKAEKLEKIMAGRDKFNQKGREGGSTNTEKMRKKNFVMSKFSQNSRQKIGEKDTLKQVRRGQGKNPKQMGHAAKKRRRKM